MQDVERQLRRPVKVEQSIDLLLYICQLGPYIALQIGGAADDADRSPDAVLEFFVGGRQFSISKVIITIMTKADATALGQ